MPSAHQAGHRQRGRRPDAQSARERILDAATDVATEFGYEGTTIARVSKKAGVSATSIYWQFADKDEMIAAVIQRSYERWAAIIDLPESQARERALEIGRHVASALTRSPEFLRFGLKLMLLGQEQRPAGHEIYLNTRQVEFERFAALIRDADPSLSERGVNLVATYAIAGADGLFLAREIGGDDVDFVALFELHARLVFGAAIEIIAAVERGSSEV